jgi:hypothetical protein
MASGNRRGTNMAGSGPYASIDHGWMSGAGDWYQRIQERRAKFLAEHPEWSIVFVRSIDQHEASMGDKDSPEGLTILQDRSLGELMSRLEARYPKSEEEAE